MKDRLKLREICKSRNPVLNMDARNFDLEKKIKDKDDTISLLNKELMGLLTFGSAKMNSFFDPAPTTTPTPSSTSEPTLTT